MFLTRFKNSSLLKGEIRWRRAKVLVKKVSQYKRSGREMEMQIKSKNLREDEYVTQVE